jgi:hypothetical protein
LLIAHEDLEVGDELCQARRLGGIECQRLGRRLIYPSYRAVTLASVISPGIYRAGSS